MQPLLYVFAPLWGYDAPFFRRLPNVARWCEELSSRSSNPFSRLYSHQEHLYAFGIEARRIFDKRAVSDEVLGLGLASLSTKDTTAEGRMKANAAGSKEKSVMKAKKKKAKRKESAVSSHICV